MDESDVVFNPKIFERVHDIGGCVRFLLETDFVTFTNDVINRNYTGFWENEWVDYIPHFHTTSIKNGPIVMSMLENLAMHGVAIRYLGDGLAESFYTDPEGNFLYYAIVTVRRCSDSFLTTDGGKATYKWLERRAHKKWDKGRGGIKEMIGMNIYDFAVSCGHLIPIGIDSVYDFGIPNRCHLVSFFSKGYEELEEHYGDNPNMKGFIDYLFQKFAYAKSLEKSDTPTWITPSMDLCLMLLNTCLSQFDHEQFRLFSPAVFIELPDGFFRRGESKIHAISACMSLPNDEGLPKGLLVHTYYDVDIECECGCGYVRKELMSVGVCPSIDCLCNIGDYVCDTGEDEPTRQHDLFVCGRKVSSEEFSVFLLRFIVNLVMYVNSQSADVKRRNNQVKPRIKGSKKQKKKCAPITLNEEYVAGTNVKLSRESREAMIQGASGWNITYSFLVRGHWRNQACGPGRSLRRRRWIEPYIKGKDLASRVLSHSYTDKDDGEDGEDA